MTEMLRVPIKKLGSEVKMYYPFFVTAHPILPGGVVDKITIGVLQ